MTSLSHSLWHLPGTGWKPWSQPVDHSDVTLESKPLVGMSVAGHVGICGGIIEGCLAPNTWHLGAITMDFGSSGFLAIGGACQQVDLVPDQQQQVTLSVSKEALASCPAGWLLINIRCKEGSCCGWESLYYYCAHQNVCFTWPMFSLFHFLNDTYGNQSQFTGDWILQISSEVLVKLNQLVTGAV